MNTKQIKHALSACILVASCATTSLQAEWTDTLTLIGYGSINAESQIMGARGGVADNSNFGANDMDLVFNFQPADNFRTAIDISYEDGTDTSKGRGSADLAYFFMEYSINDSMKIRVGKQFTSFGIYNEIQAAKVSFLTIDRPHFTNIIDMSIGGPDFFPEDITGITLLGNLDVMSGLSYQLSLSNGSNPGGTGDANNPHGADNDDGKAVTGKTVLSISDEWSVGASFHSEKYNIYKGASTVSLGERTILSYALQLEGEITDDLALELEFMGGSYEDQNTPTGSKPKVNRVATTVMLSYALDLEMFEDLTLYSRYSFGDADTGDKASSMYKGEATKIETGFNKEIFSIGTSRAVVKFAYTHSAYGANTRFAQRAGDITRPVYVGEFVAQLAASF